jgi:hypothetical protein
MSLLPLLLVAAFIVLVLNGRLVSRRKLAQVEAQATELQATLKELGRVEDKAAELHAALRELDLALVTQTDVLQWLPQWMVADFDCPNGPHEYLARVTSRGNHYEWCRHCNRMKRTVEPCEDDTRNPVEVIYALQFGR